MNLEQLEFSITRYLDGDLPAEEVRALELTLASDAVAKAMLAEHRRLTAELRALPGPDVVWEQMAGDFSAVVTGTVDEDSRSADQKLNLILKAAGPTPEVGWDALAKQISSRLDAELDSTDESDEQLDSMLKGTPLPALNWDRLAGHLSEQVAEAAAFSVAAEEESSRERATVLQVSWVRNVRRFAIAAVVAVAATVGFRAINGPHSTSGPDGTGGTVAINVTKTPTQLTAVAVVVGPQEEKAAGPAVSEIQIGPAASFASADTDDSYIPANRSPVVIAMPVRSVEETSSFGFE